MSEGGAPQVIDPGFLADLSWAGSTLLREPLLPVLTVAWLGTASLLVGVRLVFLFLAAEFVIGGWFGVQRVWFLRASRGRTVALGEVPRLVSAFAWRFAGMGFLVAAFFLPLALVLTFLPPGSRAAWSVLAVVAFVLVGDVVLTFVAPALAFSTRSPIEAWSSGWKMLRTTWRPPLPTR